MKERLQLEHMNRLSQSGKIEIYSDLEGYTRAMLKRIEVNASPIKQIINGEDAARFHKLTDDLVKKVVSSRTVRGLHIKNLIRKEDKHLAIEVSDPETLKETRLLPVSFNSHHGMIAIFGDYMTMTSMVEEESITVIIKDKTLVHTYECMFDSVWEVSTPN